MGRTIVGGQRVRVVAADRPARGQVWAFVADDGQVLVHRCRRVGGSTVTLHGDGNAGPDRPVDAHRLIGRVVAVDGDDGWSDLGRRDAVRGAVLLAYRDVRSAVARVVPPGVRRFVVRRLRRG